MLLILVSFVFCCCANANFYYAKNGKMIKWRENTKIPDIKHFINQKDSLNSELRKELTKESCKEQNKTTNHKDIINLRIRKRAILNAYKIYSETRKSQSTTSESYYPDINRRYFSTNMVDEYEIYGFMNPNDLHKFDTQILYSESVLKKLLKNK